MPLCVIIFNFTHHPVLSALLLILSASRFLDPDFLRWTYCLFCLRLLCMEWPPFPLRQKPSMDSFKSDFKMFLFPKHYTCHVFGSALLCSSATSCIYIYRERERERYGWTATCWCLIRKILSLFWSGQTEPNSLSLRPLNLFQLASLSFLLLPMQETLLSQFLQIQPCHKHLQAGGR